MHYYYVCSCGRTGRAQHSKNAARAQGERHAVQAAYYDRPGENPKAREHKIEVRQ